MSETLSLRSACKDGDIAMVSRLIEAHAPHDESAQGDELVNQWQEELRSGLYYAAQYGHPDIVALLLSHGVEIHESAFIGSLSHLSVFKVFVDHGFDMNSTEFKGEPAMRLGVDNFELLNWMLQHGANPNVKNSRGVTPLATAVILNRVTEAQLLLDYGAVVEPHLIHRAIKATKRVGEDMFHLLVKAGVDINYEVPDEGTALHLAASYGDKDRVELLLRLGANPNIVLRKDNGQTFTAADLAQQYGEDEVYELLRVATAPV